MQSEKLYRDFRLTLEFRVPAGGNSGVHLRCTDRLAGRGNGMEVQIADEDDERGRVRPAKARTGASEISRHEPGRVRQHDHDVADHSIRGLPPETPIDPAPLWPFMIRLLGPTPELSSSSGPARRVAADVREDRRSSRCGRPKELTMIAQLQQLFAA